MSLKEYEVRESREDEQAYLSSFLYEHNDDEHRRLRASKNPIINDPASVPSLVAVHRASGKIVGSCFMDMQLLDLQPDRTESLVQTDMITEWMEAMIGPPLRVDLFKMFPAVKRIANLRDLLVVEEHRQRGLGGVLLAEAIELAKRKNEKAGFRSVADFDVANVKDKKGVIMFPGVESYIYSVMVKEL